MDESEVVQVDDLQCDVCGDRTFQEREGFYYCVECGTKKEQLRAVEISATDTFNDISKHLNTKQRAVKKQATSEENEITSWEFYNYVLRGFMQELLNMGAKEELKLMTLQVWAAYLGHMEVAFCNSNELGLPKLNVRALSRDARIMYNYKVAKRRRERIVQNTTHKPEDERTKWREWRKTKRKLDESGYSHGDARSASTRQTAQSIQLQWSRNARKSLKRVMPLKHLDKHSMDSLGVMGCHSLRPKATTLNHFDRNIYNLSVTKLYVVLGIALNLVGDDIQLSDLLRLVDEEHLTSRYMLGYLPDNVAAQGKTLLKELDFNMQSDKITYKKMRHNIEQMSRFIDLNGFQMPDLSALAQRYVLELNLPPVVASYVICLIDQLPPTFEQATASAYPRYEARVMAYIIYVLKLLFGLDDVKERAISESAMHINEQLTKLSAEDKDAEAPPLLFVFTEWMQYVELRKMLVGYYNESFAHRFGLATSIERKVDDYLNKEHKQKEQEYNYNEMLLTPAMQRDRENLIHIFEKLLKEQFGESSASSAPTDHIEFQPSLTPAHSYFRRLLLHATQAEFGQIGVHIPDFMRVEHAERQMAPFKNKTDELAEYLTAHNCRLRVEELACQADYEQVGIFQTLRKRIKQREFRANLDIQMDDWLQELKQREKRPIFKFHQPVAKYGWQYQDRIMHRAQRRQALEVNNPFWEIQPTPTYLLKLDEEHQLPLNELHAIQTFDESNMEPLNVPLQLPRRNLERPPSPIAIAIAVTTKEELVADQPPAAVELTLNISNFDCWLLHGYMSHIRDSDKRELRTLFPCSFRWLLETCASTIGVSWNVVYQQLLTLEVMFHHGIEDWGSHRNHLRLKYNNMNKDINMLAAKYREMW